MKHTITYQSSQWFNRVEASSAEWEILWSERSGTNGCPAYCRTRPLEKAWVKPRRKDSAVPAREKICADLGEARYPFLLVGFWYARILLRQGRYEEAQRVIQRHLDQATPLGLYGEHTDEKLGTVRGNFPQLFSHSALVTTLMEQQRIHEGLPLAEQDFLASPGRFAART